MIQTYDCKKNKKVMVWGCFRDERRTSLCIMDHDFKFLKHGYFANSYLKVLNAKVKSQYQSLDSGYVFMQDNASIYTVKKVKQWFAHCDIEVIVNWLLYSPDLNLIEHIQWVLKK